jgi:hypothetical protein
MSDARSAARPYRLKVNSYDRTATLLIALLAMAGLTVLGLAIVFFANKFTRRIEPIEFVPVEATSPNANQGFADQPEPPGAEDAPELSEPQLQDTLEALTSLVSLNDALLAEETIDAAAEAGKGEGLGDARQAGPGGDGVVERVQRWERWKIRWEPSTPGDFAAWLDQYEIRVGVLGRDNKVHVAYGFAAGSPRVESAEPLEYAAWGQTVPVDGPMPALTNDLARKADIAKEGRYALLFFPFDVERLLWTLENRYNKTGDVNKIRETVFTVQRERDGYAFQVIDQKYF